MTVFVTGCATAAGGPPPADNDEESTRPGSEAAECVLVTVFREEAPMLLSGVKIPERFPTPIEFVSALPAAPRFCPLCGFGS